jgi:regulator of replication initiation timing
VVEGCELTGRASGEPKKVLRTVFELNFSEHDKVFEDKIARLEENVGYYKDSLSRVEKNCDKLYHENKELKQRIAELESKKRKRPCFVSYVGVEEINGKEYVSMEKFATAMEELNAFFDKFFDN